MVRNEIRDVKVIYSPFSVIETNLRQLPLIICHFPDRFCIGGLSFTLLPSLLNYI